MARQRRHRGFTLVELAISLGLIIALLALLVPALRTARTLSHREQCAEKLEELGQIIHAFAEDNNDLLPSVAGQPAWRYGGLRYSQAKDESFLDQSRPLNRWLLSTMPRANWMELFCCPADSGIVSEHIPVSSHRTCCRAFGTSYRANAALFDARIADLTVEARGMYRSEVTTSPSRLLMLGDAVWYEVYESTSRDASWHGEPGIGNVLFFDGSVKFQAMRPKNETGPITINPLMPPLFTPVSDNND